MALSPVFALLAVVAVAHSLPLKDNEDVMLGLLSPVRGHLEKRGQAEGHPDVLAMDLVLEGSTVRYLLERQARLHPDHLTVTHSDGSHAKREQKPQFQHLSMYQDVRKGVAVSLDFTKRENPTMHGAVFHNGHVYEISPASRSLRALSRLLQRTLADADSEGVTHQLRRLQAAGFESESAFRKVRAAAKRGAEKVSESEQVRRGTARVSKRDGGVSQSESSFSVNLANVVDYSVFKQYKEEEGDDDSAEARIKYDVSHITNIADLTYQAIESVSISLHQDVLQIHKSEAESWPTYNNLKDSATMESEKVLTVLKTYREKQGWMWNTVDHISYFTGLMIDDDSTLGIAPMGGICDPSNSHSITLLNGIFAGFTMAHEIGHNTGMNHDADGSKNIMAPSTVQVASAADVKLTHRFSDASIAAMISLARGTNDNDMPKWPRVCIHDVHCKHGVPLTDPSVLPGQKYSKDDQCEALMPEKPKYCEVTAYSVCVNLFCHAEGESSCGSTSRALRGTDCGDGKFCWEGSCVSSISKRATCDDTTVTVPDDCKDTGSECDSKYQGSPSEFFTSSQTLFDCKATAYQHNLYLDGTNPCTMTEDDVEEDDSDNDIDQGTSTYDCGDWYDCGNGWCGSSEEACKKRQVTRLVRKLINALE